MNSSKNSQKKLPTKLEIIVILGPTASGKSDLAVKIAKFLSVPRNKKIFGINGAEIISADSRQVYKGLNIGTGKITKQEMRGIPHHLLDVANPRKVFTVADYQKKAKVALRQILKQNKIPIICGGTGFYIDALIYDYTLPRVKPNPTLRKKLSVLDVKTLFEMLKKKDPERAKRIDPQNPRRLVRALEIVLQSRKPVPFPPVKNSPYKILKLGLVLPGPELQKRIEHRLHNDIKTGLLKEVGRLHRQGLSWRHMRELGLEYRYAADYLTSKIPTKHEFESQLAQAIKKYAQRQMTWFEKDKSIHWMRNQNVPKTNLIRFLNENPPRRRISQHAPDQ